MPIHPCPNGVLRPGYVTPYYPYLFPVPMGLGGIFVDYFHTLTHSLGCERLEFQQFPVDNAICSPEECVNVLDGAVESGESFTLAVSTYLRHRDVFRYAYIVPAVMHEKIVFLEGRPIESPHTETRLIFYTVYTYGALLGILAAILTIIAVHYTRRVVVGKKKIADFTWGDFIGSFLLLIGVTLLTTIWGAAYNGNNVVTTNRREKTITDVLQQIQNKQRTILIGSSTTFLEGDKQRLFGAGNHTFLDNVNERLESICLHPDVLSMVYTPETYRFSQLTAINRICRLHQIPAGKQRLPTTWLDKSVRTGDNFAFPLAKNTSRVTIEKMNWLLLTVYSIENQSTFLLRRFVPKVGMVIGDTAIPPVVDGNPFKAHQIELPMMFYFIGLSISFIALAIEVLVLPYIQRLVTNSPDNDTMFSLMNVIFSELSFLTARLPIYMDFLDSEAYVEEEKINVRKISTLLFILGYQLGVILGISIVGVIEVIVLWEGAMREQETMITMYQYE